MIGNWGRFAGTAMFFFWAAMASAQPAPAPAPPEAGTVSGTGTVALKRRPETLRVALEVFAAGKTMKEALANLKDRREVVRAQLKGLGAAADSVRFGDPQVNTSVLEARQQMEMMIRGRMGNRAKKDESKATPTVLSSTLTAEWPLKGQDLEAILVEVAQLQVAIKAADLAGRKDLEKVTTEDEELKEELQGADASASNPNQPQPGEPAFTLVCKLSGQERARALADAFKKARGRAELTAHAAGAELGPLRRLESQAQAGSPDSVDASPQAAYLRMMEGSRPGPAPDPDDPLEARGSQPGAVSYQVSVTAAFALKGDR